jgi:hypothetical protein
MCTLQGVAIIEIASDPGAVSAVGFCAEAVECRQRSGGSDLKHRARTICSPALDEPTLLPEMLLRLRLVTPVNHMQSLLVSSGCKRFVNYLCVGGLPPADGAILAGNGQKPALESVSKNCRRGSGHSFQCRD